MKILFLLFGFIHTPSSYEVSTHVDIIELNDYCEKNTHQHVFTQLIFWDLYEDSNYYVVAWRIVNQNKPAVIIRRNNRWLARFDMYKVYGTVFIRTKTTYDPELVNRELLPETNRKGLE